MPAAWHCGGVAPIRADAARQGCATFRIALLTPLLGAAPEGVAYLARNRKFESISLQRRVINEPGHWRSRRYCGLGGMPHCLAHNRVFHVVPTALPSQPTSRRGLGEQFGEPVSSRLARSSIETASGHKLKIDYATAGVVEQKSPRTMKSMSRS